MVGDIHRNCQCLYSEPLVQFQSQFFHFLRGAGADFTPFLLNRAQIGQNDLGP